LWPAPRIIIKYDESPNATAPATPNHVFTLKLTNKIKKPNIYKKTNPAGCGKPSLKIESIYLIKLPLYLTEI